MFGGKGAFTTTTTGGTGTKDGPDLDTDAVRYKPAGLDVLCQSTNFTEKELKMMYRGFKQECPKGIVEKDTFKEIFQQFFPQGNSGHYATYVFDCIDRDNLGRISFEQFIKYMSVLARGTLQEKFTWVFQLYDLKRDGRITKDEMFLIVRSVYEMMGRYAFPPIKEDTAQNHVEDIFLKIDRDGDGVITPEDFAAWCMEHSDAAESSTYLDTKFA